MMEYFYLVVFVCVTFVEDVHCIRVWHTLYMDQTEDCERLIRNDDMSEGDMYTIMSDSNEGQSTLEQRPSECANGFNFGDRLVSVNLEKWWCSDGVKGPFVDIYENCEGTQQKFLVRFNCSTNLHITNAVYSGGSCISLYHYRGHTKAGYFFKLQVTARHEIIAFPAGGIAALIMSCVIITMVIVKIVCAVSGYDNRLPKLNLEPDEEKQILESVAEAIEAARQQNADNGTENTASAENLLAEERKQYSAHVIASDRGHRVLRVTRSNGSGGKASTSEAEATDFEYDFLDSSADRQIPPRLNRFPSFKGASIWRSK